MSNDKEFLTAQELKDRITNNDNRYDLGKDNIYCFFSELKDDIECLEIEKKDNFKIISLYKGKIAREALSEVESE